MINKIKSLFFTVVKSKINGREFSGPKETTMLVLAFVIALIIACVTIFPAIWIFESTSLKNYQSASLGIFMIIYIFCAYQIIKKEPEKDDNEDAYMTLLDFSDLLQSAGVSEEMVRMMKIPSYLSLALISDLQREIGGPTPSLPDEFFSSMRKNTKEIANKVFLNNPF